ncbi:MAG: hypothetical protein HZC40_18045 [Chloroflexi bacterium]|nr:hypothetical protein [Chloroflexota bacterium]
MIVRSWIIMGLGVGVLAMILFLVAGGVTETNVIGLGVLVGTMTLITIIRKFTRSRVI